MKKLLSTILVSFSLAFLPSSSNAADVSFTVGAGAMEGGYYGYGTEQNGLGTTDTSMISEGGAFTDSTPVVFAEVNIGDNMSFGVEWAVNDLETPTNTNAQRDGPTVANSNAGSLVTNTAQASFSDLTTVYIQGRILGGLYTKIMYHNVNVVTNESLGTGGTYPDREIEGLGLGLGYQHELGDLGIFVRAEVTASAYESVKAVNTTDVTKSITVTDIYGAQGSIKVGKVF